VNAYQSRVSRLTDAFVTKLPPSGTGLVYSTYLGGYEGPTSFEGAFSIAVDSGGNAYVAGATDATDFPVVSPYQATNHGSHDAFVAMFAGPPPLAFYTVPPCRAVDTRTAGPEGGPAPLQCSPSPAPASFPLAGSVASLRRWTASPSTSR